jgi:hypothetical protein
MPNSNIYNAEIYQIAVASGKVAGVSPVLFRGLNTAMSTSVAQTLWDYTGDYVWPTVASEIFVSSDNAADTNTQIRIRGLDANYYPIEVVLTTNGQTSVGSGSVELIRVNDIAVSGGDFLIGNVYVSRTSNQTGGVPNVDADVHGLIPVGTVPSETGSRASDHVAHNGFYTVPAGHSLILTEVISSGTGQEGFLFGRLKLRGEDYWTNRNPLPVTGNRIDEKFNPPLALPEGVDFELRGTGGNNQLQTVRVQGYLVRNGSASL